MERCKFKTQYTTLGRGLYGFPLAILLISRVGARALGQLKLRRDRVVESGEHITVHIATIDQVWAQKLRGLYGHVTATELIDLTGGIGVEGAGRELDGKHAIVARYRSVLIFGDIGRTARNINSIGCTSAVTKGGGRRPGVDTAGGRWHGVTCRS